MHELSLAQELARRSAEMAEGRRVSVVQARCSAGVDREELASVFPVAVAGTAELEGAALQLEGVAARLECSCGFAGDLAADQVFGHIGLCPGCGCPGELSGGLELVGLLFAGPAAGGAGAPTSGAVSAPECLALGPHAGQRRTGRAG